jgi:hypothetical protein
MQSDTGGSLFLEQNGAYRLHDRCREGAQVVDCECKVRGSLVCATVNDLAGRHDHNETLTKYLRADIKLRPLSYRMHSGAISSTVMGIMQRRSAVYLAGAADHPSTIDFRMNTLYMQLERHTSCFYLQ